MAKQGTEVEVTELRYCDVCTQRGTRSVAHYDARTSFGPWANLCVEHFKEFGLGLGVGVGQRYVYAAAEPTPVAPDDLEIGDVFDTDFEVGCVVTSFDFDDYLVEQGAFLAADSDGVVCQFHRSMVRRAVRPAPDSTTTTEGN